MAAVCIQAPRPSQMGLRPWSRATSTRHKHRLSEKQPPCLSGDSGLCPVSPDRQMGGKRSRSSSTREARVAAEALHQVSELPTPGPWPGTDERVWLGLQRLGREERVLWGLSRQGHQTCCCPPWPQCRSSP